MVVGRNIKTYSNGFCGLAPVIKRNNMHGTVLYNGIVVSTVELNLTVALSMVPPLCALGIGVRKRLLRSEVISSVHRPTTLKLPDRLSDTSR